MSASRIRVMIWEETIASRLISLDDGNKTWAWKIILSVQARLGNVLLNLR